jgi:chemotaxis protein methyltransferase CheR
VSLSQSDIKFVCELVYRRSAIVLDDSKEYLIATRLADVARVNGCQSVGELVARAQNGSRLLHTELVEAITTHETSFFRDLRPFESLRHEVLPALIAARAARRTLNIWCAGCSSGQEPYSIAMLLLEHFPDLARWPVRILATDLSHKVLERARSGRYRQLDVNRGLSAKLLLKHFVRVGSEWQIDERSRALVQFEQLNLLDDWKLPFVPDVVFLRNVLIYFDVDTKRRLLMRVRDLLPDDGALYLGVAETTLGLDDRWSRIPYESSVYYKVRQ